MLKLVKVAVTGGIASGKTTVCRFLKELGACVVSADEIVHQLLTIHTNLGKQVINLIGPEIVINQQIDRSKIAQKVFTQTQLLEALEKLLHPAVYEEIEKRYEEAQKDKKASFFVAEVPLLFETGGERYFDYTIAVVSDETQCRKRFQGNTEEFYRRSARQLSQLEKQKKANFIIENNGSLSDLRHAVIDLLNRSPFFNESR